MSTAIWWIRRDLRLADNQALAAARQYDRVIPVYILDPVLWGSDWVGEKRQAFLLAGLCELDQALQARGSRLIIRLGDPTEELAKLVQETHAAAIWTEADYSPYARQRDQAISRVLPLILVAGVSLFEPGQVLKNDGTPYVVYTPFSKTCKLFPAPTVADCLPAPDYLNPCSLPSLGIPDTPTLPASVPFLAGEVEGQRRLHAFAGQWQDPHQPVCRAARSAGFSGHIHAFTLFAVGHGFGAAGGGAGLGMSRGRTPGWRQRGPTWG
jgi:deoxyribodipyrimidine photo-lyase